MLRRDTTRRTTTRRRGLAAALVTALTALGMVVMGAMESFATDAPVTSGQTVVLRSTWKPNGTSMQLRVATPAGRTKIASVTLQQFSDPNGASYMGFCLVPFAFDEFEGIFAFNNSTSYRAVTLDEHIAGTQDAAGTASNVRQIRWLMNNVPAEIRNRTATSTLLAAFEGAFWHYAENATVTPVSGVNQQEYMAYYQKFVAAADASADNASYRGMIAQPRSLMSNLQSVALVPVNVQATTTPVQYAPQPKPLDAPPSIGTVATTHGADPKRFGCTATTITDTVTYANLWPGTFTLTGTLMDKASGQSTGITAGSQFTLSQATAARGQVKVAFTLTDAQAARYCGSQLVVFEKLTGAPRPVAAGTATDLRLAVLATHEDLTDAAQTVSGTGQRKEAQAVAPAITTTAYSDARDNKFFGCTATTITDVVKYRDLPLVPLTLSGVLMDKATGQRTGITASTRFTPTGPMGEVRLQFRLSDAQAARYCRTSLVAFEEVIGGVVGRPGEPVPAVAIIHASHKDINSADQTVTGVTSPNRPAPSVPYTPPTPQLPMTGTNPALRLVGLAAFNMLLVGGVFLLAGRTQRRPALRTLDL